MSGMVLNIDVHKKDEVVTRKNVHKLKNEKAIYKIFDQKSNLIYIGKSIKVKDRIKSHFEGLTHTKYFTEEMYRCEVIYMPHTIIMDIAELFFISYYAPKYNKSDNIEHKRNDILNFIKTSQVNKDNIDMIKTLSDTNIRLRGENELLILNNNFLDSNITSLNNLIIGYKKEAEHLRELYDICKKDRPFIVYGACNNSIDKTNEQYNNVSKNKKWSLKNIFKFNTK
jgi:predicted GIY-YIG superfamily endonuclease